MDKVILKFTQKCKGFGKVKTTLQEKKKGEGPTLPHFKTYYKATIIKTL